MHLLATTSGVIDGAAEAVDLRQTPGDVVVLSAADSELACLAAAHDQLGDAAPTLRLANLLQLQHNFSVDLYAGNTLAKARLIIIRLLGGKSYWPYGVDVIEALARENNIKLALIPGGQEADAELSARSTLGAADVERLRQYFAYGGQQNAKALLQFCGRLLGRDLDPPAPEALPKARFHQQVESAKAAIIFYRSVIEGGQTQPIDALATALTARGLPTCAIYVSSLKDEASAAFLDQHFKAHPPSVILNATGFAVGDEARDPLARPGCVVLQVALAGSAEEEWQASAQGLRATDLAMNVVLPELDGRVFTRAISFKADQQLHAATQCRIVTYKPVEDRITYVAELATNWASLRTTPNPQKRAAIILANYPDKDGRVANGVGYDTPASTIEILKAFAADGYETGDIPTGGNDLIQLLLASRQSGIHLSLADYQRHFSALPEIIRIQMIERWGRPDTDPHFKNGAFNLAVITCGHIALAIQPARGYGIDPKATYHDPALVPPHFYLATYFWLRHHFGTQAIIHNGKHGNLEWLPGKAVGLSATCWPEVALGPLPQLYPFIVNDPGEGTQAKRRTSAVIIDHLTPPLTRAESYGPLKDLEALVDEYYLASGLDKRRLADLRKRIFDLTSSSKLDQDAGLEGQGDDDLQKLDAFLCDLKEAQIRDGLHILGQSPTGQQETDLLAALTRVPRGLGESGDASLIRTLSNAFSFEGFDPLSCQMAEAWTQEKPTELQALTNDPWRTNGDTVERLELFASSLLRDEGALDDRGHDQLAAVLDKIKSTIRPALTSCGPAEMAALLRGLNGKSVRPGPSGAPTRGRLDVLPTGKNFFSLDNRALPTPTAWTLGEKSASELLKRHFQDTGQHLKVIGLSAWGTANMRTGGDDIAQALALLGVKPLWDSTSWRVTGFEVQPLAKVGRPRVDVTLRISGFFRDAFPAQIELLDKAIRAVAALDEPEADNPLAARTRAETATLSASGLAPDEAARLAGARIFGAKPGAYGAGLQALVDERIWDTKADLAAAYVTWGAYAYGAREKGENNESIFKQRLARIEAVLHNQDNREHDLLDSDDYYQFEGGMTAAAETQSGTKPRVYHNDHSRPERPVIRTLEEEISRVMRSRVVNPKWINGVKRHGYKGAFEIAATVDYMFAFAATTGAVKSHHFDLAHEAYILDAETRHFIADNNPDALKEIAARFEEAIARGLWQPKLNSTYDHLKELQS
ncbi:cobaltochelatase subunit CobN [Aestuariivirga litoralis]|uniref:cobaltochelatase subunit CobN n=1 Tax=Aestuariivirga litoralis TaxID=2650924 RepID=UPI0018C507F0|nr:cobaltochelatase subunit CobN [Aestuariivirga litoralis]MBG1231354.1 cobaltochelatase subunit CobN [Aestuariivirga litoralis]